MSDDRQQPRCSCGLTAVIRFRLLPHRHLAPSQVWAPEPVDRFACGNSSHQREVRDTGVVLGVESLEASVTIRKVKP